MWFPITEVVNGTCRPHLRAKDRARYASSALVRHKARQRTRARRRGVEPMPIDAAALRTEFFDGECAYCPAPATGWDHIVPITQGGDTTPDNTVPACGRCNSSKRTRELWAWLALTGRAPAAHKIEFLTLICPPD